MQYSTTLLQYFENLAHAGVIDDVDVRMVKQGSVSHSDLFKLFIQCSQSSIVCARFQAYGSVALLAMLEYTCDWLEGQLITAAKQLQPRDLLEALQLPPTKAHTAHQICKAVQECLM